MIINTINRQLLLDSSWTTLHRKGCFLRFILSRKDKKNAGMQKAECRMLRYFLTRQFTSSPAISPMELSEVWVWPVPSL